MTELSRELDRILTVAAASQLGGGGLRAGAWGVWVAYGIHGVNIGNLSHITRRG